MEFNKCLCSTQRLMKYTEGSRNSFLFTLGNKCFRKGLEESEVKRLAAERLGRRRRDGHGHTHRKRLHIYRQDGTGRGEEKDTTRGTGDRLSEQELCFQAKHGARPPRDVRLIPNGREIFLCHAEQGFQLLFLNISRQGIAYPLNSLKSVIDSDYSPEFNPFTHYSEGNARWDRKTDHIRKLADTIQAEDQEFWREGFRRWIVAMVASALRPGKANQEALVLHGAQGKGKSTWIRHLLPRNWQNITETE